MYEHFFNFFGLREDPFHVSPDPRFYYPTRAHESALAELLYGIQTRQGIMVLTGEAGTGKTTLLNQLLDWLHRQKRSSAYVFHALLGPVELLQFILRDFGVPCSSNQKGELVNALHNWLLARNSAADLPVLILDESQALTQETLEEVRLLLNLETPQGKLLQIILAGQPELDEKLRLPGLRQFRQRIMFHSRLPLLTLHETAAYISCRLTAAGCPESLLFPPDVVHAIYSSSRGIPRIVNLLCGHALISAYAEQKYVISTEMIERIALDFDLIANPLAVSDQELQPKLGRITSFPAHVIHASPVVSQPNVKFNLEPVPSEPVAPTPALEPLEEFQGIPKYWHRRRSRSSLAALARRAASYPQRALRAVFGSLVVYIGSVFRSFGRDCRNFFRAFTLPSPALELDTPPPPDGPPEKPSIHRNVLIPIANWLRQPISPGQVPNDRRSARSASRK
jgi:general secretion pathway protein A